MDTLMALGTLLFCSGISLFILVSDSLGLLVTHQGLGI